MRERERERGRFEGERDAEKERGSVSYRLLPTSKLLMHIKTIDKDLKNMQ